MLGHELYQNIYAFCNVHDFNCVTTEVENWKNVTFCKEITMNEGNASLVVIIF